MYTALGQAPSFHPLWYWWKEGRRWTQRGWLLGFDAVVNNMRAEAAATTPYQQRGYTFHGVPDAAGAACDRQNTPRRPPRRKRWMAVRRSTTPWQAMTGGSFVAWFHGDCSEALTLNSYLNNVPAGAQPSALTIV